MPYIDPRDRAQLDPPIYLLLKALVHDGYNAQELAGRFNYAITCLIMDSFFSHGPRYANIAIVTGMLETCKLEMYRRLAAPYEDEKAEENGDVYAH